MKNFAKFIFFFVLVLIGVTKKQSCFGENGSNLNKKSLELYRIYNYKHNIYSIHAFENSLTYSNDLRNVDYFSNQNTYVIFATRKVPAKEIENHYSKRYKFDLTNPTIDWKYNTIVLTNNNFVWKVLEEKYSSPYRTDRENRYELYTWKNVGYVIGISTSDTNLKLNDVVSYLYTHYINKHE